MTNMKPAFKQNGFGIMLRTRRKERGLTLDTVAAAVGVTSVYIGFIERGYSPPPALDKIAMIAKFFGDDLLEWVRASGRIPKGILDELTK